ncbi:MAG: glutamine transporter substrate-binding protein [Herbinix sp.]|jgi:polar amino acid transport system substrate-binding protein|nr:glutamine transporter substrate-binding protein [Herbinix sp.]
MKTYSLLPFEQYDEDGITPIGLDCDIIEAIAKDMGLEVEYVDTAWDGIFAGLDTDKYDCIISGVTITEERIAKYDFTQSYIQNYQCMVIMKDGKVTAKSPDELSGLKVGYQSETTSDIYVTDLIDKGSTVTPFEYEKILECFSDLKARRIDAVVCDSTVTYPFRKICSRIGDCY